MRGCRKPDAGLFAVDELDELADGAVALDGMAQGTVKDDFVAVAATILGDDEVAGGAQLLDDALDGTLGDADGDGHFAHAHLGIDGNQQQHVRVVGEEGKS